MELDELIAAAGAETGLTDFGDASFRKALEVLVTSLDDEAELNDIGRAALPPQIVSHLVNRLRVVNWLTNHPEIAEEPIDRPVFIIGMTSTGASLLSRLLNADEAMRSPMRWESQNSVPPPQAATFRTDGRIVEAPEGPTECAVVYAQDFKSILWETVANVPTYSQWLTDVDYTSTCTYHRQVLQLLQSRAPGRWSLKSPGHRLAIDALTATYPDAYFVVTHRDPITVTASTCSLINSVSGTFSDADHRAYIARHWVDRLDQMMQRVDGFRDRNPSWDKRFFDVTHAELMADPLGVMRRLYDHIEAPFLPDAARAMAEHLVDNPQGQPRRHIYSLEELELDRDELESRFADYRVRYDIPPDGQ